MNTSFIIVLLLLPFFLRAQNPDSLSVPRKDIQKNSMLVLGGWAAANMITGAIAYPNTSGSTRYFHQMNLLWNIASLGIASVALLSTPKNMATPEEELGAWRKSERIFLINSALDVGYIAAGIYMHKRGMQKENDRLNGYGEGIIVQGAFLLVFDGVLFTLYRKNVRKRSQLLNNASIDFTGRGVRICLVLK